MKDNPQPPAGSEFTREQYLEFEKVIDDLRNNHHSSMYYMTRIEEWFRSKGYRMFSEETKRNTMKSFYMIYREGNQALSKKHETLHDAVEEITRLVKKYPEENFYILQATAVYRGAVEVKWEYAQ